MAKNTIILRDHINTKWITLPTIGDNWSQEEQDTFLGVLVGRCTEIEYVVGVSSVKSSAKGVSGKGTGKIDYVRPDGDWRDGALDMLSNAIKVSPWLHCRVDLSSCASRWAARRREKSS